MLMFFYFYFRLPQESKIRDWIDKNAMNIGHAFISVWVIFLFVHNPKLGLVYGIPLLIVAGYFVKKKNAEKNKDNDDKPS